MEWASNEVVTVLAFLLPGLVAVIVFYSLTSHPKPNEMERIVQALAFTIASQAISTIIAYLLGIGGIEVKWPEFEGVVLPFFIAIALALLTAAATNHDFPHKFLRQFGITRETSFPSEWYAAFAENRRRYVVLHLKDGRRLYGWPEEWPKRTDQGHFRISECEWLTGEERQPLTRDSAILIPAQAVDMVEFVVPQQHDNSEE